MVGRGRRRCASGSGRTTQRRGSAAMPGDAREPACDHRHDHPRRGRVDSSCPRRRREIHRSPRCRRRAAIVWPCAPTDSCSSHCPDRQPGSASRRPPRHETPDASSPAAQRPLGSASPPHPQRCARPVGQHQHRTCAVTRQRLHGPAQRRLVRAPAPAPGRNDCSGRTRRARPARETCCSANDTMATLTTMTTSRTAPAPRGTIASRALQPRAWLRDQARPRAIASINSCHAHPPNPGQSAPAARRAHEHRAIHRVLAGRRIAQHEVDRLLAVLQAQPAGRRPSRGTCRRCRPSPAGQVARPGRAPHPPRSAPRPAVPARSARTMPGGSHLLTIFTV